MRIFTPAVWWATHVLLGALLYRGLRARLFREYPVFYGYAVYVLCSSLVLFRLSLASRQIYTFAYWIAEFISALYGIGIIWEIYDVTFAAYAGVRRAARGLITALVLAVTVAAVVDMGRHPIPVLFPTTVEVEQNLRFIEAILLAAILSTVIYYRVPLGRNVRSLLYGYALYIGTVVITLTLQSFWGAAFLIWWTALQPFAYLVTLVIWCAGLWQRAAKPAPSPALQRDYEWMSQQTAIALAHLRKRVIDTMR